MSAAQNLPKRWLANINRKGGTPHVEMLDNPNGRFVLYSDYAALAAERDALKAALTTARVWMRAINALAGSPESESEPLAVIAAALALSQPKP